MFLGCSVCQACLSRPWLYKGWLRLVYRWALQSITESASLPVLKRKHLETPRNVNSVIINSAPWWKARKIQPKKEKMWSKSLDVPRSLTDLKRPYLHPRLHGPICASASDGMHANTSSLAATVKTIWDLEAYRDLDYTWHTSFFFVVFLHF